ncbi:unnamed protein product [Prunus armeniaca]
MVQGLNSPIIQELKFLDGVGYEIEIGQTQLQIMQGYLKDADARQGQNETIHIWVASVRDATYDLEDVIETFFLKVVLKRKPNVLTSLNLHQTRESGGDTFFKRQQEWRIAYPHIVDPHVVGLALGTEILATHLIKEKGLRLVSICGMGGLGKTTLAKQVYHHGDVKRHFDCFAWVLQSLLRDFRLLRVLKFEGMDVGKLPGEIGNLVHLSFLSVKDSNILAVPSSIANLGVPIPWNMVLRCPNIYKLRLLGHITKLPEDLMCLTNLTKLTLSGFGNLKDDHIKVLEKLSSLRMLFLDNWNMLLKEWKVEKGAMLSLCKLHIAFCLELEAVPDGLQYITTLKKLTIRGMHPELCCRPGEGGEDFYKIQHVQEEIAKLNTDQIAERLWNTQRERKCLVVLDDIWTSHARSSLQVGFPMNEETESRTLLTTRNKEVTSYRDKNGFLFEPQSLNDDESWELFEKIAVFRTEDTNMCR